MTHSYHLNDFCNIIASLRKERAWTQGMLAKKLGISPQSISKWECGIGYPDITLFPLIAEVLSVPIGMLFGETRKDDITMEQHDFMTEFSVCKNIQLSLGNVCHVEFIEECGRCQIKAAGDSTFLHYFDTEQDGDTLFVNIKNPSGSSTHWREYDRQGYENENFIQIYTGCVKDTVHISILNYLDLDTTTGDSKNGNYEVICRKK